MARREKNDDTKWGLSNPRILSPDAILETLREPWILFSIKAKWKMAEGERQSIFSDRARNGRTDKSNPLLSSVRKIQVSEKSSLSQSFEAPKCYGTTRNPMQPQCDVKLIGHVLHPSDTLQGLAIKYGVTVSRFFLQKAHNLEMLRRCKSVLSFSLFQVKSFFVPGTMLPADRCKRKNLVYKVCQHSILF